MQETKASICRSHPSPLSAWKKRKMLVIGQSPHLFPAASRRRHGSDESGLRRLERKREEEASGLLEGSLERLWENRAGSGSMSCPERLQLASP